jgi:hypothetical protein
MPTLVSQLLFYVFASYLLTAQLYCVAIADGLSDRTESHKLLSKELSALTDTDLKSLIETKDGVRSSYGKAGVIQFKDHEKKDHKIFVKLLPLTEKERQNVNSTPNLFQLPTYYQYGVGSCGFGVWRELAAHQLTTQWVLDREIQNFPIMYHYRVLHNIYQDKPYDAKELEEYVAYWGGSSAIEALIKARNATSNYVAIFIECMDSSLDYYLKKMKQHT